MSRYSIFLWDHEYDLKFHLGAFDRIPGGWWKFSSWFQFREDAFQVAQTALTKYTIPEPEYKVKEKKRETKRRSNKTKKSKKPARKGRKVH